MGAFRHLLNLRLDCSLDTLESRNPGLSLTPTEMLVRVVAKLLECLREFLLAVALDLVLSSYGLGHAHATRGVETKNNAYVLASQFFVLYLGRGFDQKVDNVGFWDFFIFKRHVI
jgi:hypothetical protein